MIEQKNSAVRLGTEPVGKLLLTFSIPAISGMLANALYNAVDRVFVGRYVGEAALGGLSLVLPLVTISMAFAMLFGVGAANMISMRLGQQKKEEAENALNHCFWLLIIASIALAAVEYIFLDTLLVLLGAAEGSAALGYAAAYYRIILIGTPFFLVSFGLSHCTRAQGFPVVSMIGMFIGAGLNIVLDALFIIVFGWGAEGAALATILSQLAAAVWILYFNLRKRAVIHLHPFKIQPSARIFIALLGFGSSQFILQMAMSSVQFLMNKSVSLYGVQTLGVNGVDTGLAAMNIVTTFIMLFQMPVFGINQGSQPVLGFNYGAKRFDRVRRAYIYAVAGATVFCVAGFIWALCFPESVVRIFAPNGSAALLSFTPVALRISMIIFPLNGFQIVSTNMFVVTGRPKISILLSLLRQCLLLIPAIIVFGKIWGLYGIAAATPFADALSFLLTAGLVLFEMKKLRKMKQDEPGD